MFLKRKGNHSIRTVMSLLLCSAITLTGVEGTCNTREVLARTIPDNTIGSMITNIDVEEMQASSLIDETVVEGSNILGGDSVLSFTSHTFRGADWEYVNTRECTVNVDALWRAYNEAPMFDFDYKDKRQVINCLWEFLVNQNEVDPIFASAVIGHVCIEGEFGLKEGSTTKKLTDIGMARNELTKKECCGWGIIQWSFADRRKPLLEFYEEAWSGVSPETDIVAWEKARMAAECVYLLEELHGNGLMDSYYELPDDELSCLMESTVGMLSREYVRYRDYTSDWRKSNGSYRLKRSGCSGSARLEYALNIYKYYMG